MHGGASPSAAKAQLRAAAPARHLNRLALPRLAQAHASGHAVQDAAARRAARQICGGGSSGRKAGGKAHAASSAGGFLTDTLLLAFYGLLLGAYMIYIPFLDLEQRLLLCMSWMPLCAACSAHADSVCTFSYIRVFMRTVVAPSRSFAEECQI